MSTENKSVREQLAEKFINQAKAMIVKSFADTEGVAQQSCLAAIKETIQSQADVEKATASAIGKTEVPSGVYGRMVMAH